MSPITIWYRLTKMKDGSSEFLFNHIEDGHCSNEHPTPNIDPEEGEPYAVQKAWKGAKWRKEFGRLVEVPNTNVLWPEFTTLSSVVRDQPNEAVAEVGLTEA